MFQWLTDVNLVVNELKQQNQTKKMHPSMPKYNKVTFFIEKNCTLQH